MLRTRWIIFSLDKQRAVFFSGSGINGNGALASLVVSSFLSSVEHVQQQTVLASSKVCFQVLLGLQIFETMLSGFGSIGNHFLVILRSR